MSTPDDEIEKLRAWVRALPPTGSDGFEGLLAAVLTDLTGISFVLAKSGSQQGRDGDPALAEPTIKFEAKRYDERVPREQVLSKIAEIAVDRKGQTDLWILGSTGIVAAQDVETAKDIGSQNGVGVLVFEWSSGGLPGLPALLALAPQVTADFLGRTLGETPQAVRATIAAVEQHPQFPDRSHEIKLTLQEPSLAPAYAAKANGVLLRRAFESSKLARNLFGQALAPGDAANTGVLNRPAIQQKLADCTFGAPDGKIVALLGVDGSGKSWLFAQTWLAQNPKALGLVLRPSDFTDGSPDRLEDLLISKCIRQTEDSPTEAAKARWRRYFKTWRKSRKESRPIIIVFVDGINERNNLPWDQILDALNGLVQELQGKLVISCRSAFFSDRLEKRLFSPVDKIDVPEWSDEELTTLLSMKSVVPDKLSPAVFRSLKNPRVFAIASRLLDNRQIERAEELSVSRLLFEHMRSNDPGVTVPPPQFVRHVRNHADEIIRRLRERDERDLTVFDALPDTRPTNEAWPTQFDAVSAGRFFVTVEGEPTSYQLTDDGLPLALGLALLSAARGAERNHIDLAEELSRILDPIAALDRTFDVLLAAVVAAVLDLDCPDKVAAALIEALVGLQNANSACYPEFRALAKARPKPFFMALESGALKQRPIPNLEWLTEALSDIGWEPMCLPTTTEYVHRWLNLFSRSPFRQVLPFGLTQEKLAAEVDGKRSEIDGRFAVLSAAEQRIVQELVSEDTGDYGRLSTFIFRLLAGRPVAPFARSLRNWKFADALNPAFPSRDEFRQLLTLNRVDWIETRTALLTELRELEAPDISATGQWARAGVLQATGDLKDGETAAAIIEELTKDRQKFQGWRLVESFCASDPCDPASERPDNIDKTAANYLNIDFSKLYSDRNPGPESHFFDMAMIGLARFMPHVATAALRKFASNVLTRDGTGFRYGVFVLDDHSAALDDDTARRFVPKAASTTERALIEGDKNKEAWVTAQCALKIAFPHLSGDEQLQALVFYPKDDNLSLELGHAMRGCDPERFHAELLKAIRDGDSSLQFKLLVFARCNGIAPKAETKPLVLELVSSPSTMVRLCALGLILRLRDDELLQGVVASGWTARTLTLTENSFEIWYGSRLLVKAAERGFITDVDCIERIALNAYPDFISACGRDAAALVAPRLDAAIERAAGYTINRNLPQIEQSAVVPDAPAAYYLKDRRDPRETQLEALKRVAENANSFFQRHASNLAAFNGFLADLTAANAELLVEPVTANMISEIAAIDLPLVKKWRGLLAALDGRSLSKMHNVATAIAEAVSQNDPSAGAALFERLGETPPIVRVTLGWGEVDLYTASLWSAADSEPLNALRFRRLDGAPNDRAIATEVLAAYKADKEDLLRAYVADRVERPEPSYVARAIMVAGFSNLPDWAIKTIDRFQEARGFLAAPYETAKYAMDRYRWSVHWTNLLAMAKMETDLWRYAVILGKIVDGRFRILQDTGAKDDWLLARYAEGIESLLKARIKKWQDSRSKKLFGLDAPDPIFLK
jgi:hypothetical protein